MSIMGKLGGGERHTRNNRLHLGAYAILSSKHTTKHRLRGGGGGGSIWGIKIMV